MLIIKITVAITIGCLSIISTIISIHIVNHRYHSYLNQLLNQSFCLHYILPEDSQLFYKT